MNSTPRRTWTIAAIGAIAAAAAVGAAVTAGNDDPDVPDTPVPVEPDGGIGDTPVGAEFPTELTAVTVELPDEDLIVDDGTFDSLEDMADASDIVVVGEVIDATSIGRLAAATDPTADEFVAITVRPSERLRGSSPGDVVIAWAAYSTDEDGTRVADRTVNGVRPPAVGDRVVLFLQQVDPGFAEFAGGAPTHELVKLDGIGFVTGDVVTEVEAGSSAAELLRGMTVASLRDAVSSS
jgi:hypothetical protein